MDAIETCSCEPGELCRLCVPAGLDTLVQLRLSQAWASEGPELRRLLTPMKYLAATAHLN